MRRLLSARRRFVLTRDEGRGWRVDARRGTAIPARDAPPIVALAGLGLSGWYLLPLAAELAPRFPVWVPVLPGYGGRGGPRDGLEVPQLADVVVAWMDQVAVPRAALVGNSVGCQIAVEVAARHPDRICSMVLQGPTMDPRARSHGRQLWRLGLDAFREPPSLIPLQVADWLGTGPRRLAAVVHHAFAHRIEARLADVACPTLVVRGARDPIVPQRWVEEVTAALPQGTLAVVPGGSHALPYSSPRAVADLTERHVLRS